MSLQTTFKTKIVPELQKALELKNVNAVPRVLKVTLNVGLSRALREPAFIDVADENLRKISGQKPIRIKAKKSISNFKIRQGMIVGAKVTLRGKRMYDFLEKLISITLPRVRDFRGLSPKIIDRNGSMNIGLRESIAFPEIRADEIEKIHGLEISITTSAKNHQQGVELFKALGFPLIQK